MARTSVGNTAAIAVKSVRHASRVTRPVATHSSTTQNRCENEESSSSLRASSHARSAATSSPDSEPSASTGWQSASSSVPTSVTRRRRHERDAARWRVESRTLVIVIVVALSPRRRVWWRCCCGRYVIRAAVTRENGSSFAACQREATATIRDELQRETRSERPLCRLVTADVSNTARVVYPPRRFSSAARRTAARTARPICSASPSTGDAAPLDPTDACHCPSINVA